MSTDGMRHCASGHHFTKVEFFKVFKSSGRIARDCRGCVRARADRMAANAALARCLLIPPIEASKPDASFPGVDIDAIHYKRGLVSPALLARRGKNGKN